MRRDGRVLADRDVAVFLGQLPADVGVQRNVERADLLPQAIHFGGELVRSHVVIRAPHRAGVGKAHFARALIREDDHARVALAHRRADGVPALPGAQKLVRVATVGHHLGDVVHVETLPRGTVRTPFALAVVAIERGSDLGQLGGERGIVRHGNGDGELDEFELARDVGGKIQAFVAARLLGQFGDCGGDGLVRFGRHLLGVVGDESFRAPSCARWSLIRDRAGASRRNRRNGELPRPSAEPSAGQREMRQSFWRKRS